MDFFILRGSQAGVAALLVLLALVGLAFKIWMLVDAVQRPAEDFSTPEARTWWVVGLAIGMVLSVVGIAIAIAYYFIVRKPALEGRVGTIGGAPAAHQSPGPPPSAPSSAPPPSRPAPALVNCRNCGAKLVAGARFCHACGASTQPEGT